MRLGVAGRILRHHNKVVHGIQTKTNSIKIFGIRQNKRKFQIGILRLCLGDNGPDFKKASATVLVKTPLLARFVTRSDPVTPGL